MMKTEKTKRFSEEVFEWRKSIKYLPKQAAAVFEVPTGTYRTWEKGSRTPLKLAMIEIRRRMEEVRLIK